VLEEVRPHNAIVQNDGAIEVSGDHQPDQEEALQQPIERNPPGDEVHEEFKNREDSEDHPVGEPLLIVVGSRSLDGMDGHIGWIRETDDITDELPGEAERKPEYRECDAAKE